ncbi:minor capsid protein [Weissella paramesenteroides]|uniref:minor capsid protein n=1 Tax=Weissella paramesenteroides TaxID=1249 RepID=UPI0024027270|nr:minor capsid protein [Weissella paramesenteroides]MDF8367263.1 minor capsid protein [Weissella paramesenteroides]
MKSNDYWTKRTQEIMAQLDKDDPELTNAVLAEYKQAAEEIDKKIYNFYDKYAKDNKLSYQEAMKRVRAVDMRDYVKRANAYRRANKKNPELLKRLNAQYMSSKITRLELLKLEIEFSMLQASNEQVGSFTDYLKNESAYVYGALVAGNAIKTLNNREIETILNMEWSGANYSSRIWRNNDVLANKLKDELVKAAINGNNPVVTARRLRKIFDSTKANTKRLVRTESTYVANATTAKRYEEMGVEEYEFTAVMDRRTSTICREMNGETFKLKDFQPGTNAPAMHPNCRSTIVPSTKDLTKYNKYLDPDMVDDLAD